MRVLVWGGNENDPRQCFLWPILRVFPSIEWARTLLFVVVVTTSLNGGSFSSRSCPRPDFWCQCLRRVSRVHGIWKGVLCVLNRVDIFVESSRKRLFCKGEWQGVWGLSPRILQSLTMPSHRADYWCRWLSFFSQWPPRSFAIDAENCAQCERVVNILSNERVYFVPLECEQLLSHMNGLFYFCSRNTYIRWVVTLRGLPPWLSKICGQV